MGIIKTFARKIGMDCAIAYSSGSRIVAGIAGVLTVFFLSTFLSGVEQGFYYTFGSLLAMQVFFELGLTSIMTQFVAHEVSHLSLNENNKYDGEEKYKSRLASLIRFCVKWYSVLSLIVFIFLIVVGIVYFNRYGSEHGDVEWKIPWLLICIGTAAKLFQSPFNSILMGLGKVKEMSEVGFWQQVVQPISIWVGLACGIKLYVVGIGYIISVILWQIYINKKHLDLILYNLWKESINERVSYLKEIFPFQWKIAISWISGYFIYQLFNPVLFATEGAVVAGQMGMSIALLSAVQNFSNSWVTTKVPLFSNFIALKKYKELDAVYNKTNIQMSQICLVLLISVNILLFILRAIGFTWGGTLLADRLLPPIPMILMSLAIFANIWSTSWGIYLRSHKREPLLLFSVVVGVLCTISTLGLGKLYGLYGITIGYAVIMVGTLPWVYSIFIHKKIEWHGES